MSHKRDPIAMTTCLHNLVFVFMNRKNEGSVITQDEKERKAINDCFQLLLGRDPTENETQWIMP